MNPPSLQTTAPAQPSAKDELIIWTWAGWEPAQFYRRLGGFHEEQEGNSHGLEKWIERLGSLDAAKALNDASINWVTTHFFKGFGLKTEAREIEQTAELIRNYHREGIKVFAYIQYGTIMPETLTAEEPESEQWQRVDWHHHHDGHPYEYGEQYWRVKPCASHDGFRNYLLRCVDKAIEIGADGVWIDNLNSDGCHCDACQREFRKYLAANIKDPWTELGLPDLSGVSIPRVELQRDPLFQAWTRFRAEETKTSMEIIARHARERKPDVVVAANFGIGATHLRNPAEGGNWVGNYGMLDVVYAENQAFPAWENGRITSQHAAVKLAAAIGVKTVPGASCKLQQVGPYRKADVPSLPQLRRVFAESLLFGAGIANGPWGMRGETAGADPIYLRDASARANLRQLAGPSQKLHALLQGSTDAAPVAILYSFESMSFDDRASLQALTAVSQLLMQHQIPFRYALSDHPENLEGVKLLILPHILGVSDQLANHLKQFVADGGRILATGRSTLYDASFRMRLDYALADVFCVRFSDQFEAENQNTILVNEANGSILIPGEWGLADRDGKPYCTLAGERIVTAIRQTLAQEPLPEVLSPLPHVGFEMRRMADGSHLLGLINYADDPVRSIRITLPETLARTVRNAVDDSSTGLEVYRNGCKTVVTIPRLDVEIFLTVSAVQS